MDLEGDVEDLETDLGLIKSQFGFDRDGKHVSEQLTAMRTNFLPPNLVPSEPCTTVKGMAVPKPFLVASTPPSEEGRYLVWNSYGIIKAYKNDEESTIEINFHDSTIHHEIIVDNTASHYILGDINSEFIALASKRNANKESELFVHNVTSWDHESRKWSQAMNGGEVIECLCLGEQFVAVLTDLRFLRIFTPTGTQRSIVSVTGSLLTMCARGSKIAIAHANGAVLVDSEDDYEHQLSLSQYEVSALAGPCPIALEWTVPLAISPFSKLSWLHFSTSGNLVAMDEDCTVRLHLHPEAIWVPVVIGAELLKDQESDFLWPISLSELPRAQFRFIYCRNSKHPPVNKTSPPPTTVPFGLPVAIPDSDRNKLEANLMALELQQVVARQRRLLGPEQEREMAQLTQSYISNLLKLFSVSCQMNRESRAAEIAHRCDNPKLIQGLCNYAAKVQRPNLSEKVAAIGRERLAVGGIENERRGRNAQIVENRSWAREGGSAALLGRKAEGREQEQEGPVIAPTKTLMAKRKAPQFGALLQPNDQPKLLGNGSRKVQFAENSPSPFGQVQAEDVEGEGREGEGGGGDAMEEEEEEEQGQVEDEGGVGGESELLNSSTASLFLPNSLLWDASPANNPFKKARRTPAQGSAQPSRGFTERPRDENEEEGIPDFFDSLSSASAQKDKN